MTWIVIDQVKYALLFNFKKCLFILLWPNESILKIPSHWWPGMWPDWHCAMQPYHILGSHIVCFISSQDKLKSSALSIAGEKVTPKYDIGA